MTTPTREQVVQWAKAAGLRTGGNGNYAVCNTVEVALLITLARADLEATIAEQAKQIEEMAEAVRVLRDALINHQKLTRPIEKSMQALAIQPSPEILAARDQRVAEACAELIITDAGGSDSHVIATQLICGKWREYL